MYNKIQSTSIRSLIEAPTLQQTGDESEIVFCLQSLINQESQSENIFLLKLQANSFQFKNYFLASDVFIAIDNEKILSN